MLSNDIYVNFLPLFLGRQLSSTFEVANPFECCLHILAKVAIGFFLLRFIHIFFYKTHLKSSQYVT